MAGKSKLAAKQMALPEPQAAVVAPKQLTRKRWTATDTPKQASHFLIFAPLPDLVGRHANNGERQVIYGKASHHRAH